MSWDVGRRHELCGDLVCRAPLHVGGWEPSATADLAIARDGQGRPLIPGTSIAGALRAYLVDALHDEETIRYLFGWIEKQEGAPSRIRVDDAPVLDGCPDPQVRTGVGIDRHTRSAASGFLYQREILPEGTRFSFRLVADEPRAGDGRVADAFERLSTALRAGHIRIGAARTRGLGRVRLERAQARISDLAERDGLRNWLTGTTAWHDLPAAGDDLPAPGRLVVTVSWRPVSPVLVKDSLEGSLVDVLPLTATDGDKVRLLLPGSSVKGVLRSHAERIVRTLLGRTAPDHLRESLDEETLPGVVGLFGRPPQRRAEGGSPSSGAAGTGWRGALEIADCHTRGHLAARDWQAVVTAQIPTDPGAATTNGAARPAGRPARDAHRESRQEAALARRDDRSALTTYLDGRGGASAGNLTLRIADHVAVDRWTGGASDSALFSVLEPVAAAWDPLRLTLDCGRAGADAEDGDDIAVALLLLVLRDLKDGWLTFGFGATRGQGHIEVSGIAFEGPDDLSSPWSTLVTAGTLDALLNDPPEPIRQAMQRWTTAMTNSHVVDLVRTIDEEVLT